ncbi:MAG TPA: energy transducer TonB [Longimicrobium sp.]|jgi:TonB family protein
MLNIRPFLVLAGVSLALSARPAHAQESATAPVGAQAAEPRKESLASVDPASVDTMAVYEIAQLTTAPKLENRRDVARAMARNYPHALRDEGIPGSVTVAAVIGRNGQVEGTRVISATRQDFGEAAEAVARTMRFTPGKIGNVPVRVRFEMPVTFSVQGRP